MNRIEPTALAQALRTLDQDSTDQPLQGALQHVVDACAQLFDLDGCGLMLADEHGEFTYVVASNRSTRALERAQLLTGQGPCVDAYLSNSTITTPDATTDPRWPALTADPTDATHRDADQHTSVGAVLGTPVRIQDIPVGSLDAHRPIGHHWDKEEARALTRFASMATAMLETAVQAHRAGALASQLEYAIAHRAPIERGVGYLMARDDLTQPEAFDRLRHAARSTRSPIGDVARELITTGQLPLERTRGH